VNSLSRIFPFVWPSRRKLLLSFFFAALVAVMWGATLSVSYPVVKILLENQTLGEHVQNLIEKCERQIDHSKSDLKDYEVRQAGIDEAGAPSMERKMFRAETKITSARKNLARLRWIEFFVVPRLPSDRFLMFTLILVLLLVVTLLKLVCMFAEEVLVGSVVQLTVMRVRKACFRRVLALDYQTLKLQGTSELMSRFTYDVEALGSGLGLLGGKLIREPLKALACLSLAFWINWQLMLLSVVFVPIAAVVFHRIGKVLKKASQKSMESVARIYKVLEETFESLKIVIAFDGGMRQRQQHHRESKNYYHKSMKIAIADALTNPATELLGMSAVVLATLPGAYLVLRKTTSIWEIPLASGEMDMAELSMMYTLLAGVLDPIRKLSSVFSKVKRAGAAADRVFELIDMKTLVHEPAVPRRLPREISTIEFQDVGFTYLAKGSARPTVLDNISLKIEKGEVIAVVGENGSGKSTLVNLLPRFLDPDRGGVLIDGIDIRDCSLADLRGHIGIVTQETLLFDDSIYENIRYGNCAEGRSAVENAADQAFVTQFLDQLPERLETRVGEKGTSLSGGQRQRIALARAILRNPDILVLDEATSAIDSLSERLIHQTLETFVRNRTTFIITHSISDSILKLITRVVVLERGRVIASGKHADLVENCPAYRRLYQAQVRGAAGEATSARAVPGDAGSREMGGKAA
jgi:subfamily B ATP-binding cassette protein MsbA